MTLSGAFGSCQPSTNSGCGGKAVKSPAGEPLSTHLWMLAAFADDALLSQCYQVAADGGYHWHEFGDVHLLLP